LNIIIIYQFCGTRGTTIFIETDDALLNFGYQILDFGCCKAVSHPSWDTYSFASIIYTTAPIDVITNAIEQTSSEVGVELEP
jgi:hypothetical protein